MYSKILISALCGLAIAAPKPEPQSFDLGATEDLELPAVLGPDVTAVSGTVSYNPTSAASAVAAAISTDPVAANNKRDITKRTATPTPTPSCKPEPNGAGPVPGDGSVAAYLDTTNDLSAAAQAATIPAGYVSSFTNLQASTQQIGYLSFKTLPGIKYDVDACANFCNSVKFCVGFNIYYERDPKVDPACCPNPPPVTNIKCALYGYPVAKNSATNKGQYRGPRDANGNTFQVVIAGSNGYSKLNPCPTPDHQVNFTGPSTLLHGAINAPLDPVTGADTYLGMKLYNNGPYNPGVCASACQAQTAYDRATAASDGSYKPCNFFNSYILFKNEVPLGTYCSFYTRTWDDSYAVNTGYWYGSDQYVVGGSFTYSLTTPDPGKI